MRKSTVTLLLLVLTLLSAAAWSAQEQKLTVEDLACRGNAQTSCTFILGQLYLSPGSIIDEEEIENAKLRLSALRNFTSVSIYLEKGSARGKARVIVEVVEASPFDSEVSLDLIGSEINTLQAAFGRLTYNNLFSTGKILDLRAAEHSPLNDYELRDRGFFVRAAYVDPHLLDSKRNYLAIGASYAERELDRVNGDFVDSRIFSTDLTLGRRLWDFSYFSLGYQYRPVRELDFRVTQGHGTVVEDNGLRSSVLIWNYGWNTQDDPYFPTRGSRLQLLVVAAGGESEDAEFFYNRVWRWGRSILTVEVGDDHNFGFRVARSLPVGGESGDIRRGRWFVGAFTAPSAYTPDGHIVQNATLRAGVLLETRRFGIVRFTIAGTKDFER